MIISVEMAKQEINDFKGWSDQKIERKLKAIEEVIRTYTHNNFQNRGYRRTADIVGGSFYAEALTPFEVGDTIQVSQSQLNRGLYVVTSTDDSIFEVKESVKDEKDVLVTKVSYPADVVECAMDLLQWSLTYGGKVGVKSETLSRHSVTYEDSTTLFMGYPVGILNGLKLHAKARF